MVHKSLHLLLPNKTPFDKDNWFESFVGNFVVPIIETGKVHQYWFTRYGHPGRWDVRFRFTVDDYKEVEPLVDELIIKYSIQNLKDEEGYTLVGDLGTKRFLENNRRQSSQSERAQLILNYLHSVASIFVDCLSYRDENGYFYLEKNTDHNNPHGSIFESLNHLFCNLTDVTTMVLECEFEGKQVFKSELYFSHLLSYALESGKSLICKQCINVKF